MQYETETPFSLECYIAIPNSDNIKWHDCKWTRRRKGNNTCSATFKRKETKNEELAVQCPKEKDTLRQIDGDDETWKFYVKFKEIADKEREVCVLEIAADKSWKVGKVHEYTDWSCTLQQCKHCCDYNENCYEGNGYFASDNITIGVSQTNSNSQIVMSIE